MLCCTVSALVRLDSRLPDGGGGMKLHYVTIVLAIIAVSLCSVTLEAEEVDTSVALDTVQVVVNKAKIMRLSGDADVVLVANPEIADVVIDSPRLLFVLGLQAGETSLLVLDEAREEILHANVMVVSSLGGEKTVTPSGTTIKTTQVKVLRRTEQTTLNCAPRCTQGNPVPSQ